ncbi:MAG: ATP phosphoribosyltransferase regulatory subunit [Oscillospiraceae bacterium]|jgi:ATP phosphoribosyltransferase regulatory subunit|nr:ATP phosphoribosyltransferase regulatory subunit [Oscillospiraceae bacterium]
MRETLIRTPEGMRDTLFDECAARRGREAGLFSLFQSRGFQEVSTPVLERYELFPRIGSPLSEETMVKVIGRDGRICVLRPDNTAPIARLAATRLQNEPLPLKLWYTQPVFRAQGDGFCEIRQAGVEIIGGKVRNYNILNLACEATGHYYGQTPHIEVSHADILQTLFGHMKLDVTRKERALSLIGRKNFAELGDEFPDAADLLKLVRISGGLEALDEAAETVSISLDRPLKILRNLLQKLPDKQITVDFALAPSLGYYTGVFFRGYVDGAAGAVLSGGWYSNLLGLLGREALAVGFAIHLE